MADVTVSADVDTMMQAASNAAIRAAIGTAIGTDVQAHDAVLDATTASFLTADETKLDGIEASADVTDTANVTAAGALMDSELTSIADVKALDQSVVSGSTPTFTNTNFTEATDKNYVTDAQQTIIDNTSGVNTGDQTNISGNAATVTTNANLTGGVTSVGNAATVATNANLTGHVTSVGNAAILGSFTTAQLNTAISDGSVITQDNEVLIVAISDETTDLTTGTAKTTFRMPYAMTLTEVRASVTTAPTGSVATFDINETASTILSTKITIDATEKTSETAATPPVISDSALADDAEITIDIDTIGSTIAGAGAKIYLIGTRT